MKMALFDNSMFDPPVNCTKEETLTEAILRERKDAMDQIGKLALWIMENVPGEPSQSEGAIDTAIRVMGKMAAELQSVFATYATVMNEQCPSHDQHCSCVPILKHAINELMKIGREKDARPN